MDNEQNKTDYCGLDIGTTGVRLVQLKVGSTPGLIAYGSTAMPADLIGSDAGGDRARLAEIISRLVVQTGSSAEAVVAAVSASHTLTAVISVPAQDAADLTQTMHKQAETQLGLQISEIKADWYVLGPSPVETAEQRVLLVAAPRAVVDSYTQVIAAAGLELLALETDTLALGRSLSVNPEIPVLIIDFGNTNTKMALTYQYLPQLTRTLPIGQAAFIDAVAQNLNVDGEQARQFLQRFGVSQSKLEGQVFKAVHDHLNQIIAEVSRLLEAFSRRQSAQASPEKVVLTGEIAALPELTAYLSEAIGLPVEVGNPWAHVSYPPTEQPALASRALGFAVAVGLAQRNFV